MFDSGLGWGVGWKPAEEFCLTCQGIFQARCFRTVGTTRECSCVAPWSVCLWAVGRFRAVFFMRIIWALQEGSYPLPFPLRMSALPNLLPCSVWEANR